MCVLHKYLKQLLIKNHLESISQLCIDHKSDKYMLIIPAAIESLLHLTRSQAKGKFL